MDSEAINYKEIKTGKIDEDTFGVFVDEVLTGSRTSTEFIYWDKEHQKLTNPLYSKKKFQVIEKLNKLVFLAEGKMKDVQKEIKAKQEELEEEDMPEVSEGCSDLVLDEKESPMEDDIFMKVGGENG